MTNILCIMLGVITAMIGVMMIRLVKGPSVFDRLNVTGVIGTETIVFILLVGYINDRPDMYVDIAVAYALLGFISSVIIARYFKERG